MILRAVLVLFGVKNVFRIREDDRGDALQDADEIVVDVVDVAFGGVHAPEARFAGLDIDPLLVAKGVRAVEEDFAARRRRDG